MQDLTEQIIRFHLLKFKVKQLTSSPALLTIKVRVFKVGMNTAFFCDFICSKYLINSELHNNRLIPILYAYGKYVAALGSHFD
jgi:hypothetical protein